MRDLQAGVAFGVGRKRCGLGAGIKSAAIELEGQVRLHRDLALRIKAADKGQAQVELAQGMHPLGAANVVGKVDRALVQAQVVECKARWRGGRFLGCTLQTPQHVVDVVMPVTRMRQGQMGLVYGDGIHHRRQPKQGLDFRIQVHPCNAQLGGFAIGRGQLDIRERELQRPGLEVQRANSQRASECRRCTRLQLAFEHGRDGQPGQRPHPQPYNCDPEQAAYPDVFEHAGELHGALSMRAPPACTPSAAQHSARCATHLAQALK